MTGSIKFYVPAKGFGFITTDNAEIFFHKSEWKGKEEPRKDQPVTFEIAQGKKGEQGKNVKPSSL